MGILRNWQQKHRILATDLQEHKNRLAATTPLTFSGNVEVSGSQLHGMHVYIPPVRSVSSPPEIRRVQVTTIPDQDDNPSIVLVKNYDGTDVSGDEFPVFCRLTVPAADDEIYAMRPTNGVIGDPEYTPFEEDARPVEWEQLHDVAAMRMKVTSTPAAVATTVVAKELDDADAVTGNAITVQAIQGHSINDIIYAIRLENETAVENVVWHEVLPPMLSVSRYKVMQVLDTQGKLGLDWVRAH